MFCRTLDELAELVGVGDLDHSVVYDFVDDLVDQSEIRPNVLFFKTSTKVGDILHS